MYCFAYHYDILVSGFVTPLVLELGNRWRQGVSFNLRPRYRKAKRLRYLLNSGLCGQRNRSVLFGDHRNICHLPTIPQYFACTTRGLATTHFKYSTIWTHSKWNGGS